MSNKRQARRIFSTELKLKVVKDIESGKATIAQVCREFSVSDVSVYNWLNKYSKFHKQGASIIVELKSEAYRSKELEKKIKDLEAALGRKQLEVEFLNKLIELASDDLGIDIKKKALHAAVSWFRLHSKERRIKMTHLYSIAHDSRQGLHQFLGRQCSKDFQIDQVIGQGIAIRKRHPNMGCRTMFELMQGVDFGKGPLRKYSS